MNFLNKKYTSLHATSPYGHSNSRSFLPSSSTVRQMPSPLSSNNCEAHPSEIIRHMCLECVELLCSECIGEHLQLHRQAKIIPKIISIRQLRADMESKIEHITHQMNSQNPNLLDLDGLKKHVIDKIEAMRKDLIRAVDDWVGILKGHLLSSLGFEEVTKVKAEMERLRDQVGMLQQSLSTSGQPAVVKKVYQIDSDKLEEGYESMFVKFKELQKKAEFDIVMNWKQIIKGIESNVIIKGKEQNIQEQADLQEESKRYSSPVSKQTEKQEIE